MELALSFCSDDLLKFYLNKIKEENSLNIQRAFATNEQNSALRAENAASKEREAKLHHLLFLVTAPLARIAGSQNVPNQTVDLAEEALSLINRALESSNE